MRGMLKSVGLVAAVICLGAAPCAAETPAQAVKRIGRADHGGLPAAQAKKVSRTLPRGLTISNEGKYPVRVYFHGPESKMVKVAAGKSAKVTLKAGKYQVAVEPLAGQARNTKGARVAPLYGAQRYTASAHYWLKVYPRASGTVGQGRKASPDRKSSPARRGSDATPRGGQASSLRSTREERVQQAVARIKRGPHSSLPPAESQYTDGPVGKGMTIENHTPFGLIFYFKGPVAEMAKVPAGKATDVTLVVGKYEVAVEAEPTPGVQVQPFYGKHSYQPEAHYWLKMFVSEL